MYSTVSRVTENDSESGIAGRSAWITTKTNPCPVSSRMRGHSKNP